MMILPGADSGTYNTMSVSSSQPKPGPAGKSKSGAAQAGAASGAPRTGEGEGKTSESESALDVKSAVPSIVWQSDAPIAMVQSVACSIHPACHTSDQSAVQAEYRGRHRAVLVVADRGKRAGLLPIRQCKRGQWMRDDGTAASQLSVQF